MKTTTLIQAQANVMKLTSLTKGDAIKIIEDSSYSTDIYYGVVLDILNTGEKTFFQVLKYKTSYSDISAEITTYSGEKELSIFPASPEEIKTYLQGAINSMKKSIEDGEKALQVKIEGVEKAEQFMNGEMSKELKSASFTEVTQVEFDQNKREKQRQIDALSNA